MLCRTEGPPALFNLGLLIYLSAPRQTLPAFLSQRNSRFHGDIYFRLFLPTCESHLVHLDHPPQRIGHTVFWTRMNGSVALLFS